MAINISQLRRIRATDPPRVLIYGPPGMGKTTLASEWPDPVFLQVEDGTPGGRYGSIGLYIAQLPIARTRSRFLSNSTQPLSMNPDAKINTSVFMICPSSESRHVAARV